MAEMVTGATFESVVLKSNIPVVVDMYAEWCMPCKMIAPSLDALSTEMAEQIKIVKLDIDKDTDLAMKYGVRSVPTLLFFKKGEPVDRIVGALPKSEIAAKIKAVFQD